MRKVVPALLLASILTGGAAAEGTCLPAQVLWARAQTLYQATQNWQPSRILSRTDELDDSGKVTDTTQVDVAYSAGPQGTVVRKVLAAWKNGQDITADRQKAPPAQKMPAIPFDPAVQSRLTLVPGPFETRQGRSLVRFDFAVAPRDGDGSRGRVWLDPETGSPVEMSFTLDPLPQFVEKVDVLLQARQEGDHIELNRLEFQARGSFLFIHKNIHSVMVYSRFFPRG